MTSLFTPMLLPLSGGRLTIIDRGKPTSQVVIEDRR